MEKAEEILSVVVEYMRWRGEKWTERIFVMMDEAWKVIGSSKSLAALIREGRKYGVGIIMASQIVEDIEAKTLSNFGSIFIFRMQNRKSLGVLSSNYGLHDSIIRKVQNEEVGKCLLIHIYKTGERSSFFIRKVTGVDIGVYAKLECGNETMEIERNCLESTARSLCGNNAASLLQEIASNGEIELDILVEELIKGGAERRKVLAALRSLGVNDNDIADAFAVAIEKSGIGVI